VREKFDKSDSPVREINGMDFTNISIEKPCDDCHSPLRFGRQHSCRSIKDVIGRPVEKIAEEKE